MRPFTTFTAFTLLFNTAASSSSRSPMKPPPATKPLSREHYKRKEEKWKDCLRLCQSNHASDPEYIKNDFAQCYLDCKFLDPRIGQPYRSKGITFVR